MPLRARARAREQKVSAFAITAKLHSDTLFQTLPNITVVVPLVRFWKTEKLVERYAFHILYFYVFTNASLLAV